LAEAEIMSKRYEKLASRIVGTPLQRGADIVRGARHAVTVRREPGLRDVLLEGRRTQELMKRTIADGMNCVDVGAHLGVMLHEMVKLSPSGRHHAFEPVPYKADWLRKKFPSVGVHEMALSDQSGKAEFFLHADTSSLSALRQSAENPNPEKTTVPVRRLDDVLPESHRVDFLKIDAMGAEYLVLRGAERILETSRPVVIFECTEAILRAFDLKAELPFAYLTNEHRYDLFSLRGYVRNETPLDLDRFVAAMVFPFEAFNFVAIAR
jgi:FkbM family methyltransferase